MTILPTVVLLNAMCTGGDSSGNAGETIAQNRIAEPIGPEHRLLVTEELRIGKWIGGEEADQLYQVTDIEVGPDGEIYALSGVGNDVRVFSPTGKFVRSWGRQGEGPGEFQGPLDLAVARDTVAITDGERVHFFDLSGRFLNSVWPGRQMGQYSAFAIHATNLGWVVGIRPVVVDRQEPGWPRQVQYLDSVSGALGEAIIAYRDRPDEVQLSPGVPIDPAFSRLVDHGMDREGRVYLPTDWHGPTRCWSTARRVCSAASSEWTWTAFQLRRHAGGSSASSNREMPAFRKKAPL